MKTEYHIILRDSKGRLVRYDNYGVIWESSQESADLEAMKMFGLRLIREARARRKLASMRVKSGGTPEDQKLPLKGS